MAGIELIDIHKTYLVDNREIPVLNGINETCRPWETYVRESGRFNRNHDLQNIKTE